MDLVSRRTHSRWLRRKLRLKHTESKRYPSPLSPRSSWLFWRVSLSGLRGNSVFESPHLRLSGRVCLLSFWDIRVSSSGHCLFFWGFEKSALNPDSGDQIPALLWGMSVLYNHQSVSEMHTSFKWTLGGVYCPLSLIEKIL